MGKYMRKYKGHCEVAVMEVPEDGVRTTARALALSAENSTTAKRRKVDDEEVNLSSSVSHLSSRRRFAITPENSVSQVNAGNSAQQTGLKDQCSSASSDDIPASCCSSNRSTEEESVQIEPSTYYFDCRQSREMTPLSELRSESGELESTARPLKGNSSRQPKVEKKPSATKLKADIEEFFLAEEKELLKQFSEKYNFDFENEKPQEGRFEWVKLKHEDKSTSSNSIAN